MSEHTPTPFRTGPINYADIYGADGDLVALVIKNDNAVENTRFIIRACNNHDRLLAALKALLPERWDDGTMDHIPGVKQAREAIAATEEAE